MIPRRKIHILKDEFYIAMQAVFNKTYTESTQYIAKWEEEFARFIGAKYAIAVTSGRKGMELILRGLELNKGDEVIIPAYTLEDLAIVIQSIGLMPVPADIHPETFNINPDSIAKMITKRTKVILATHLFGVPCQIEKIMEIARDSSIFVIEDCAHAVGSEFKGRKTGSFGHASFFSLDTIKPINTYGGGMVVTNDERLVQNVRKTYNRYRIYSKTPFKKIFMAYLENYLLPTPLSFPMLYLLASKYWNKKMYNLYRKIQKLSTSYSLFTSFQALIGLEKLKTLKERIIIRQKQANLLKSLLDKRIKPQQLDDSMHSNYYFFVALLPYDIYKARKFLLMHGIDAGIGEEIADDCGGFLGRIDCPNASYVFQHAIQLPLHEGISSYHIHYIAGVLQRLFKFK